MNPKETIEFLNDLFTIGLAPSYCTALNEAVKALEKQIPKSPEMETETRQVLVGNSDHTGYVDREDNCYECPTCGSFLGFIEDCKLTYYQSNFCSHCGQAIDWSEINE